MEGYDLAGFLGIDALPGMFDSALAVSTGQVANAPNTLTTVPSNAIASMQPVSSAGEMSWSGFWQDLTKGVVGYAIAKDAKQSGVAVPQPVTVTTTTPANAAQYQRQQQANPLVLLALAGLAVYAVKS